MGRRWNRDRRRDRCIHRWFYRDRHYRLGADRVLYPVLLRADYHFVADQSPVQSGKVSLLEFQIFVPLATVLPISKSHDLRFRRGAWWKHRGKAAMASLKP